MAVRHLLRIKKDYFNLMNDETKTLEVRVGYPDIVKIEAGDTILFENYGANNIFDVIRITQYKDFSNMLEHENPALILPDATKNKVLKVLRDAYPKEKERLGVYVIEVKKHRSLKNNYRVLWISDVSTKNRIKFGNILSKVYTSIDPIFEFFPKHFSWYWNKVVPGLLNGTHEIFICVVDKNIVGTLIVEKKHQKGEICAFNILNEYWEDDILEYLITESFNFLKTSKPHIIIPDNKVGVFKDIISKYNWRQTNEFLPGYYKNTSKAIVFN